MRDRFTLHSIIYRLILGVVVLAFVIPIWVSGHRPMWPVALVTIVAVTAAGVLLARRPRLHDWLRGG
ncbi:MAG TPA: hypothetical protein VKG82_08115 [Solirubrobacteraceae bacterium]|nr:hypothetical protein [Solirubrobacteraceae bacterium]